MSSRTALRAEYTSRINRVIDYIEGHIDGDLSLVKLAEVAHFSRFHFHRVFYGMVGETLNNFIQRVRLEKAANRLLAEPDLPVTEIALECGFSGSATFARAFRDMFGMSATDWRGGGYKRERKIGKEQRKVRKAPARSIMYVDPVSR
jgi:AraC family transcriptional regulator